MIGSKTTFLVVGVVVGMMAASTAAFLLFSSQQRQNERSEDSQFTQQPTEQTNRATQPSSSSQEDSGRSGMTNPPPSVQGSQQQAQGQATLPWQLRENGWSPVGTVPACPAQIVEQPPVNLQLATSILYPGQTRGGNYKPHGGFRFDNSRTTDISVTAPFDAYVVQGGQYLSEGVIQYTFDLIAPCGFMYRVGHLRVLTPFFQNLAKAFPAAQEGDSRTQQIFPSPFVSAGTEIATAVGIEQGAGDNTFVDWGVYDLRAPNEASKDAAWLASHDPLLAGHAVCWFDLLSAEDEALVRSLPPGDLGSGKKSDYCR